MDIAKNPGVYYNFSGKIVFGSTRCTVEDSNFTILSSVRNYKSIDILIEFKRGNIVRGEVWNALLDNVTFSGGILYSSIFQNSTFDGGIFKDSRWNSGTWKKGEWQGGFNKFGRYFQSLPFGDTIKKKSGVANSPGVYEGFSGRIQWGNTDCVINNGDFDLSYADIGYSRICLQDGHVTEGRITQGLINYIIFDGSEITFSNWHNGIFNGDTFADGTWLQGKFTGRDFTHSTWWNGEFSRGNFYNSTWHDGTWENGFWDDTSKWVMGFDRFGVSRKEPPDKW